MLKNIILMCLWVASITGVAIGGYFCVSSSEILVHTFVHYSYYAAVILLISWISHVILMVESGDLQVWSEVKKERIAVFLCFLIAAVLFLAVPPALRILNDEANLVTTSLSLYLDKTYQRIISAEYYMGRYFVKEISMATRPILYPFFVSILHAITGYRLENAFTVNYLVTSGLLTVTYISVRKKFGKRLAMAAVLTVLAQPLITTRLASAAYDGLALLMFVVAMYAVNSFIKKATELSFSYMCLTLMMFAYVRHESFIVLFITGGILIILGRVKARHIFKSPAIPLSLVFAFPIACQRLIAIQQYPDLLQTPQGKKTFGVENFVINNTELIKSVFDFKYKFPYPTFLYCIMLFFAVLGLIKLFKGWRMITRDIRDISIVICSNVVVLWILYSSYVNGMPQDDLSYKYYMTFGYFICMAGIISAGYFLKKSYQKSILLLLVGTTFILYNPVAQQDWITFRRTGYKKDYDIVSSFIREHKNSENMLLISNSPKRYLTYGIAAMPYSVLKNDQKWIGEILASKKYDHIYLVQTVPTQLPCGGIEPNIAFPENVTSVERKAKYYSDSTYIRISEIIESDEPSPSIAPGGTKKISLIGSKLSANLKNISVERNSRYGRSNPVCFENQFDPNSSMRSSWVFTDRKWDSVGLVARKFRGRLTEGIMAHPIEGSNLILRSRNAELGNRLKVIFGFSDESVAGARSEGVNSQIQFKIIIDGKAVLLRDVDRREGLNTEEILLEKTQEPVRDFEVQISINGSDVWGHFLFDIWSE